MAQINDSLVTEYRTLYRSQLKINTEQNKLIADQEKEKRILKKRLFWSRCEIWGYRIGIIGGFVYFIAR